MGVRDVADPRWTKARIWRRRIGETGVARLSNRIMREKDASRRKTSLGGVLPVVFDVRHKSRHPHDVDRTVPEELASDMNSYRSKATFL